MFERRLKFFLAFLAVFTVAIAVRSAQIQWWQRDFWTQSAAKLMEHSDSIETTRGTIFDCKGRPLAIDVPCINACVDYRAITEEPDVDWLKAAAEKQLFRNQGDGWRKLRRTTEGKRLIEDEIAKIRNDLPLMWTMLAQVSGQTTDDIENIRRGIVAQVETHRRFIWWHNYAIANRQNSLDTSAWYRQFLGDNAAADADDSKYAPQTGEQTAPHVVVADLDSTAQAELARQFDRFPALSLMPGQRRDYPNHELACHVIGHLVPVDAKHLGINDPMGTDPARRYEPRDLIGSSGLEELCETVLRGTRGEVRRDAGPDPFATTRPAEPGHDVHASIDINLEREILEDCKKERDTSNKDKKEIRADQHCAVVVIQVETGNVLAMVSNPGFDLNTFSTRYSELANDQINLPLLNRATQVAVEPGSTVKPMVGSGAITDGIMTPESTIQCRGVLVIDGKEQTHGHCWVYAPLKAANISPSHNAAAGDHVLPNDMLTISDGIERSCNVVFETIADRLGMTALCRWYSAFGLGRPTGVGIAESPGRLFKPRVDDRHVMVRPLTWSAGIGEGVVWATPIQMANVAATIARDGIWMRPRLVSRESVGRPTTRPIDSDGPDRVDLGLSPQAIAAVQKGMIEVCNDRDGTGHGIEPDYQKPPLANDPLGRIKIAGKTGTAQTHQLTIQKQDENGHPMSIKIPVDFPGTTTWYKSVPAPAGSSQKENFDHAWFIGYAPADHPQVAFCVFVEYGEAGGVVAGAIAHDALVACVKEGYLN